MYHASGCWVHATDARWTGHSSAVLAFGDCLARRNAYLMPPCAGAADAELSSRCVSHRAGRSRPSAHRACDVGIFIHVPRGETGSALGCPASTGRQFADIECQPDEHGEFFIDRHAKCFDIVLDVVRGEPPPTSAAPDSK